MLKPIKGDNIQDSCPFCVLINASNRVDKSLSKHTNLWIYIRNPGVLEVVVGWEEGVVSLKGMATGGGLRQKYPPPPPAKRL